MEYNIISLPSAKEGGHVAEEVVELRCQERQQLSDLINKNVERTIGYD